MKPCVMMEHEGRWIFDVSAPVSEDPEAKTVTIRVEVDGPYPSMYHAGVRHGHILLTDGERSFASQQAKDFVRELVRSRA